MVTHLTPEFEFFNHPHFVASTSIICGVCAWLADISGVMYDNEKYGGELGCFVPR